MADEAPDATPFTGSEALDMSKTQIAEQAPKVPTPRCTAEA